MKIYKRIKEAIIVKVSKCHEPKQKFIYIALFTDRQVKKHRDAWDKERTAIWERMHEEDKLNQEEVKASNRKLQ